MTAISNKGEIVYYEKVGVVCICVKSKMVVFV